MSTEAQIAANRLNAQKSTGPKTEEGKAKVCQNSLKHGLRARHLSMPNDFAGGVEDFIIGIRESMNPVGDDESYYFYRIASQMWRLMRSVAVETETIARAREGEEKRSLSEAIEFKAQTIASLQKYEIAAERSLQRNVKEFRDLQKQRKESRLREREAMVAFRLEVINEKLDRLKADPAELCELRELRDEIREANKKISELELANQKLIKQTQSELCPDPSPVTRHPSPKAIKQSQSELRSDPSPNHASQKVNEQSRSDSSPITHHPALVTGSSR